MALQTEPSGTLQEVPQVLEPADSADISEGAELDSTFQEIIDSMPDPPIEGGTTEPIKPTSDDQQTQQEPEPTKVEEPDQQPEQQPAEFDPVTDLDEVDLGDWGLGETVQPRVQQLLDRAREVSATATQQYQELNQQHQQLTQKFDEQVSTEVQSQVQTFRDSYQAAEKELRDVVAALQDEGPEAQKVLDTMAAKDATIHELNQHTAAMTWKLFEEQYPNFQAMPDATKQHFAQLMKSNKYLDMGDNDSTLFDRVDEAFKYAAFKTKGDVSVARRVEVSELQERITQLEAELAEAKKAAPAAPAPAPTQKEQATKQAVIGEGGMPRQTVVRSADEMSYEELMDRHDHLL